jgi:hypothetical protein
MPEACVHHWYVTIEDGQEIGRCTKCRQEKTFRTFKKMKDSSHNRRVSQVSNVHSFVEGEGERGIPHGQFSGYRPPTRLSDDIPPSWDDGMKTIEGGN